MKSENRVQTYKNVDSSYRMSSSLTYQTIFDNKEGLDISLPVWENRGEGVYLGKFLVNQFTPHYYQENFNDILHEYNQYTVGETVWISKYNDNLHSFAKRVWLTDEFFKNNRKFKYPINVHWDPINFINNIHPGFSRFRIINLFGDLQYESNAWYFNTMGIQFDYMSDMKKLKLSDFNQNYKKYNTFNIGFSGFFGTLVPHITIDGGLTTSMGDEYHKYCIDIIKNRIVYINKNIPELQIFKKSRKQEDSDICIFIKSKINTIIKTKILLLIFLNHEYEDSDIKITFKNILL